jgi:N-acetyl-beta-hexosaminidase
LDCRTDCKLRPSIKSIKAVSDNPPSVNDDEKDYPNGNNEGYELNVNVDGIEIKAATQWGIINAFKTLAQLIHWKDHCAFIPSIISMHHHFLYGLNRDIVKQMYLFV